MEGGHDTAAKVAAILNAAWMVRHYARGGRTGIGSNHRQHAINQLGLEVRKAFIESDDFEPLLVAIYDGLNPRADPPF